MAHPHRGRGRIGPADRRPAAAQADSFAPALTGTALTAASTGERTGTAVHEVAQETGLGQTASTATGLVETGAETLLARDQSVTD